MKNKYKGALWNIIVVIGIQIVTCSAYRWSMINLNPHILRILSIVDGVTCMPCRFGKYAVIGLQMTHAHISWRLLPPPPNAGLSLWSTAIDSGTIIWAISRSLALWIVRFLTTAHETSWRDTQFEKRCCRGVSKGFAIIPCSATQTYVVCCHCTVLWTSRTHTHTHTDLLHSIFLAHGIYDDSLRICASTEQVSEAVTGFVGARYEYCPDNRLS